MAQLLKSGELIECEICGNCRDLDRKTALQFRWYECNKCGAKIIEASYGKRILQIIKATDRNTRSLKKGK